MALPDSSDSRLDFRRLASAPLDIPVTERLVFDTYDDASYGHAPISPALFVLEDGVITSVAFAQ